MRIGKNALRALAVAVVLCLAGQTWAVPCPGDVNFDDEVDVIDLLELLSRWGPVTQSTLADIDEDGFVGVLDLLILLSFWGPCD